MPSPSTPSPPSSDHPDSTSYNSHTSSSVLHQPPPASPVQAEDSRLLSSSSSPLHGQHLQDYGPVPVSPTPRNGGRINSFASSPLNPSAPTSQTPFSSRPASRSSTHHLLASHSSSRYTHSSTAPMLSPQGDFGDLHNAGGQRGSMLLYRLADDPSTRDSALLPPRMSFAPGNRDSVMSSTSSIYSDSKYPSGIPSSRGYIAYAYDPTDDDGPLDDDDLLHDPKEKFKKRRGWAFPWRGVLNVGLLVLLVAALMMLFIFYPMWRFFRDREVNERIDGNIRINGTGQAPVLFQMPDLIDTDTPESAKSRTGFDGMEYELVFSDEFNVDGRTFYPGDDPFWEAVDLWYGATADLEWYDPSQVTTRDGALVITMDSADTVQGGLTPGSTAPFTLDQNHNQTCRSGMLQSWNKFCFTTGYIEIAATFPGPNEDTQGYWPGAWTMGNLARPGYSATTDGMWPYTYDSCDVGTFPNQTNPDGLGPAAALHSDASRSKYNFELSWLSGQRVSACSCPNSDHPGPSYNKGRGAPEIDIFEAEKDKAADHGQVASLSSQFAPFSADYAYPNSTEDEWWIYNTETTRPNTYKGSAVQQAVSALAKLPSDMFQGSGANYKTLGFEYWSDPNNRGDGYITWQVDGSQTHRVGAAAVGPDQGPSGSGVSQRLISEEPMSIILNLGISNNWQTIDLSTMMFPAELRFDYVRVYQRKGQTNVGCNPKDYPTTDYINNHLEAYQNPNMTTWDWPKPTNSLYAGGC